MNKIFEGAKFGDTFYTRDNVPVVFYEFVMSATDYGVEQGIHFIKECKNSVQTDSIDFYYTDLNGSWHRKDIESPNDVVRKAQPKDESIEEIIIAYKKEIAHKDELLQTAINRIKNLTNIDEEKLKNLAREYGKYYISDWGDEDYEVRYNYDKMEAFKDGYRKAKED